MNTKEFEVTLRQGALDAERIARDYRVVFDHNPNVIPFAVLLSAPLTARQRKVCRTLGADVDEHGVLFQPRMHIQEHRRPIWCVVFLDYLHSMFGSDSAHIVEMHVIRARNDGGMIPLERG